MCPDSHFAQNIYTLTYVMTVCSMVKIITPRSCDDQMQIKTITREAEDGMMQVKTITSRGCGRPNASGRPRLLEVIVLTILQTDMTQLFYYPTHLMTLIFQNS